MNVAACKIPGVLILEPRSFKDERGVFYESWRKNAYQEAGIKEEFLQDNVSISQKNVLRGLHFQKNQGQLVTVTEGEIFDVLADVRPDSPTYGQYQGFHLRGDSPVQVYMPHGIAHGFCVFSDKAIINYKCSQYYNPAAEGGVIWDDPTLNIKWPIESPIISEKDSQFSTLNTIITGNNE